MYLANPTNNHFGTHSRNVLKLDEVHSDVFILRDLEDISVEELSGIFGLKQSDVIELVYRARMTVIACLVRNQELGK